MKKWVLPLMLLLAPTAWANEEVIVKLKPGVSVTAIEPNLTTASSHRAIAHGKFYAVHGDLAKLQKDPNVLYAEPNERLFVTPIREATTNPKAWGVLKVKAPQVWARGITGKGIKIAVIDTGADYNHPELEGHVVKPTGKTEKDCTGWNYADKTPDPMDDAGHGTHVSGTILGKTVGVAPGATIIPVKFLGSDGSGTLEDALSAIQYAIDCKVNVMSNSWGGGGRMQSMQDLINDAAKQHILFVAAAGNDTNDNDANPSYPAAYDNVIAVAATDSRDKLASFSNWGAKSVLVAAPGVNVFSSVPGGKYENMSGTSMATPHISGVVALMLEAKVPPEKVAQKLLAAYDKVPVKLPIRAQGRVDALKAIQ